MTGASYHLNSNGIAITVRPRYAPEHSDPAEPRYVFIYHIRIENEGERTVQLRWRHWYIHDDVAGESEVQGEGVVGEQPVLAPGASFEYTSGVPLPTPSGFMSGTYGMTSVSGERFEIEIPAFSLDGPDSKRTIN